MKAFEVLKQFSRANILVQQATGIVNLASEIQHVRMKLRKLIGKELENAFWENSKNEAICQVSSNHAYIVNKYKSEINKLQYEQL